MDGWLAKILVCLLAVKDMKPTKLLSPVVPEYLFLMAQQAPLSDGAVENSPGFRATTLPVYTTL